MRSFIVALCFLGVIALVPALATAESAVAIPAFFDFGPGDGAVEENYIAIAPDGQYDAESGFGFLDGPHTGFDSRKEDYSVWGPRSPEMHVENNATPLLVDGVRSDRELTFRVDVPNGVYRVTAVLGDLVNPMGSVSLYANGELVEKNLRFRHGHYRIMSGTAKRSNRGVPNQWGFYDRVRFTVAASEGRIVLKVTGDQSDYDRLMAEQQDMPKPASWLDGRVRQEMVPPYWDVGEPFLYAPILGLEIRKHVPAPVTSPEFGKLAYDGGSQGVADAVAAFNDKNFQEALAGVKRGAAEDPLAAALVAMWVAGWADFEREWEIGPKINQLLERAVKADPDNMAAVEAKEVMDTFWTALSHHKNARSFAGESNHFINNMAALNRFQFAQADDPVYWKAKLQAMRCGILLDPHRWTPSGQTAMVWAREILEKFPENRYARYFALDEYDKERGPWALPDYQWGHRDDDPAWARNENAIYRLALGLADYFIEYRQAADGSFGGGWGDDVEIVGLFGYYGFVSDGAGQQAIDGAAKLVSGMFAAGHDIEPETGYHWRSPDSQHAAEPAGNTLPMMMLIDHGNPEWIERCMQIGKCMRDILTAVNERGHRHFRSNYTGGTAVVGGLQANDSAINRRIIFPAEALWRYNRHPEVERLLLEWADAWYEDAMRTDKGKPVGFIPATVSWEDCELGGVGAPTWWGNNPQGALNNQFGQYHDYQIGLLEWAWEVTGDKKYLEPIRLESEAYEAMTDVEATQKAPYGAPERMKLTLQSAHRRWRDIQGIAPEPAEQEAGPFALGTGEATYEKVERTCKFALGSLIKLWPHNTTEAQATDRMGFLGANAPLSFYCGSGKVQKITELDWSASYRGIERDLAAFVSESTPRKLTVHLFAFRDGEVDMAIRPWALNVGAEYAARVYEDADLDGNPDGGPVFEGQPVKFRSAGQPVPVRFQSHKTHIAVIEQTSEGRSDAPLPDLCASSKDIEWNDYHDWVMVRVHNTGIAPADFIEVVLYEGTPESGREIGRGTLSHLPWPRDLVAMTHKLGWSLNVPPEGITLTAVIDPENKIEELVETNNRASTHIKPKAEEAPAAAAPPRGTPGGSSRGSARGTSRGGR